ncbi:MAG: hypothetical protein MUF33_11690 [Candidatus Nanopelagicales bacterium]|nr:hypothetical protein [Candidatus Nanopelagicales bacterium]
METKSGTVIRILQTLLAVGSLLLAITAVFYTAIAIAQGAVPSPVNVQPSEVASQTLLETMSVSPGSTVVVQVSEMDALTAFVVTLPNTAVALLVSAILALLAALLRDTAAGRPFTAQNVKRLHWVARLTLLAAVVGWWLGPLLNAWALARLDSAVVTAQTSFAPVIVALGAYALVTIWGRGAELADFEENTV